MVTFKISGDTNFNELELTEEEKEFMEVAACFDGLTDDYKKSMLLKYRSGDQDYVDESIALTLIT